MEKVSFEEILRGGQIWPKSYLALCRYDAGHMTKMATMSIYGKILQNLLLRNQQADFHETWYVASRTPDHHSLFK